jgi:hypothetical protein
MPKATVTQLQKNCFKKSSFISLQLKPRKYDCLQLHQRRPMNESASPHRSAVPLCNRTSDDIMEDTW